MKHAWLDSKDEFEIKDVRQLTGNFLPAILKAAGNQEQGKGLCIIQSFEPVPLYSALEALGYEHHTDKISETEYRAYFYRVSVKDSSAPQEGDLPFKPTAIVNINSIKPELADIAVHFWDLIWGQEKHAIDMKTRLFLSLANGVGAGRFRQAVRELIKAYTLGATTAEFDELFALLIWNQGVGHFASEIGPSALFAAYQDIKKYEANQVDREEIVRRLMAKFGENNPDVSTSYRTGNHE